MEASCCWTEIARSLRQRTTGLALWVLDPEQQERALLLMRRQDDGGSDRA